MGCFPLYTVLAIHKELCCSCVASMKEYLSVFSPAQWCGLGSRGAGETWRFRGVLSCSVVNKWPGRARKNCCRLNMQCALVLEPLVFMKGVMTCVPNDFTWLTRHLIHPSLCDRHWSPACVRTLPGVTERGHLCTPRYLFSPIWSLSPENRLKFILV